MKIKTAELTGAALDWAVAKCEGFAVYKDAMLGGLVKRGWWVSGMSIDPNTWHPLAMFEPSTDWSQGGPIIDKMRGIKIKIGRKPFTPCYAHIVGYNGVEQWHQTGKTPLVAAMRCYVASKLGDNVDVPDELML